MAFLEKFDGRWHLKEEGFNGCYNKYYETIFTLGNGYLGTRGSLEENNELSIPSTLIAGLFDKMPDEVTELANVANWLSIKLKVNGELISVDSSDIIDHRRMIDLQNGLLYRETCFNTKSGLKVTINSTRFVSVSSEHLMGIKYSIKIFGKGKTKNKVQVVCSLDGNMSNEGIAHMDTVEKGLADQNIIYLIQKTKNSKQLVAEAASVKFSSVKENQIATLKYLEHENEPILFLEFDADYDVEYTVEKIVSIYTSRESLDARKDSLESIGKMSELSIDTLILDHIKSWQDRWNTSDIQIEGDDFAQLAVRFSIFHLLQASSERDDRVSIAAKALTGFGYKGHVFWDTELFILPYLYFTNPNLARNMLLYRYHTLDGARKKAKDNGYKGAMYAWESADTGEETTPKFVKHLAEDKIIRIWCGDNEQHISADITYGVWQYYLVTGDVEFLIDYGAEIILETARFWYSRVEYNSVTDRYEIKVVIGPDEYHENIDNNAFTNLMAKWNINLALDLINIIKKVNSIKLIGLVTKLNLSASEFDDWKKVADKIFIPFDETTKCFIQFDGFRDLENIDLSLYKDRTEPMDVVLGPERISNSKVSKQPDVLMHLFLFLSQFSYEIKKANWDFYEPFCGHGSSLSPAIHSIIASDMGLKEKAYDYFIQSAKIDLNDKMGNTEHGLHAATAGGILQAVLIGFAGLHISKEGYTLNPKLPDHWKSLKFNLNWRGNKTKILIERKQNQFTVLCEG